MKVVHVAVGVIARGDEIFITLRPDGVHQGGKVNVKSLNAEDFPEANVPIIKALQ